MRLGGKRERKGGGKRRRRKGVGGRERERRDVVGAVIFKNIKKKKFNFKNILKNIYQKTSKNITKNIYSIKFFIYTVIVKYFKNTLKNN